MALFLEGKAYYTFVTNAPLGIMLYFASMMRYLEETKVAIAVDISYLVILIGMIFSVVLSIKKPKASRFIYAVCICDIAGCLLLFNAFRLVGDILIIVATMFSNTTSNLNETEQ